MSKPFHPEKLFVEFRPPVTPTTPIVPRRYTLTHSDQTGNLFLTLGTDYAYDKIGPMRDEVLGEWIPHEGMYTFLARVYVGGSFPIHKAGLRYEIFVRELPLALEAMRYGDRQFLKAHPALLQAPLYIYFESPYAAFNRIEYWGSFGNPKH